MKIQDLEFTINGGRKLDERGKFYWPTHLRINFNVNQALDIADQLIRFARFAQTENTNTTQIVLVGSIEELKEE
jgi:hypothetical protein